MLCDVANVFLDAVLDMRGDTRTLSALCTFSQVHISHTCAGETVRNCYVLVKPNAQQMNYKQNALTA
jgi:hypothetical protein